MLDAQRDNIIASIQQLTRVAGTFAGQRDVIDRALKEIPPAIDVLIKERPQLHHRSGQLGTFSDTATGLVNDAGDDLVTNLKNLGPILGALADIGPDLNLALLWASAFPYGPTFADRITRGDYINLFAIFDLTYPRLKKTLLLGTRWGDENAKLIPAPGDPYYLNYSYRPVEDRCRAAAGGAQCRRRPRARPAHRCPRHRSAAACGPAATRGAVAAAVATDHRRPDLRGTVFGADGAAAPPAAPPAAVGTDTGRWWLMLTRFVRNQLIIFTIASIVGVAVMLFAYMQVPTLLGVGRLAVTLELPASGGLYRFSNVTYRGVQVGKVTGVKLTENGAEATMSLETSPKIPADLQAEVRSVSAVGEQYVDLRPEHRLRTVPGGRFANSGLQHQDSPTGRSDAGSAELARGQSSQGSDPRPARRDVQGVQRCRPRIRVAARFRVEDHRGDQRRLRSDSIIGGRQWAASGFAGRDH